MSQGRIRIDGRDHAVDTRRNLLEVALELGYDLPYFCWHPAMGSVGACRQCAVTQYQDDKDEQGHVVMACMTPCQDGGRFALGSEEAQEMRRSVIEFLMSNHPHDCPVCAEGGHCHLQDITVMTGHAYRRHRFRKRSHRNQDLGPFIHHEMNRCIACYRCTRYYREYAGGEDLDVFGAHHQVYFGRAEDGTLESPFAGNLVEICPTGVFTDKPYNEGYTRKWDLQQAPGICHHCAAGCNTLPGERYGTIRRLENRYHGELNGYFLCDRGRYGHGYSRDPQRPVQARDASGQALSPQQAIERVAVALGRGEIAGVGSPRASVESNFALRALVGAEQFFRGEDATACWLGDLGLALRRDAAVSLASIRDLETADAALVLGEDVGETAPRLALALRQMIRQRGFRLAEQAHVPVWQDHSVRLVAQQQRSPLFLATPAVTLLDDIAAGSYRGHALQIARLGQAIAHALDQTVPPADAGADVQALAGSIAEALKEAKRPVLVTGDGGGEPALLLAARNIARAYAAATGGPLTLAVVPGEVNSVGSALLGGESLETLAEKIESGEIRRLIVVENDLYRRLPRERIDRMLAALDELIVLDHLPGDTLARASLALPAANPFEGDGTLVNFEGRAQRSFQVFAPEQDMRESWCWLQHAARVAGQDLGLTLDALLQTCAEAVPTLAGIVDAAPGADFRLGGSRIPRQPHRYSGRTAMHAHRDIHEHQPPAELDSAFAYSMEGAATLMDKPPAVIPLSWVPRWNSVQAINRFQQEIGGPLRGGDPGVRLISSQANDDQAYAPAPASQAGLLTTPLHHVFGSEELSARAPAVIERGLPQPYCALHPSTAEALGLAAGASCHIHCDGQRIRLPLELLPGLAADALGLPVGLPGMPVIAAGQPVTVSAAEDQA